MKALILTLLSIAISVTSVDAQELFKPKKRKKDYFGKRENPETGKVRPWGLELQIGPTYTFTRKKNETYQSDPSEVNRYQFTRDPEGKPGIYAEIGLVYFNVKDPKIKGYGRIVDYYDLGFGFKIFNGREYTAVDHLDAVGNITYRDLGEGNFSNGYAYARFGVHKLQYINKTKNIFLDHSLGINADYLVMGGNKGYKPPVFAASQYFSDPFRLQLHYGLGFGIRIKKGRYLVPGVQLPILGIQDWNKGKTAIRWYSSNYYPVMFQIKYIYLFPAKKGKGCYEGDPAGRKMNEEYMQNK